MTPTPSPTPSPTPTPAPPTAKLTCSPTTVATLTDVTCTITDRHDHFLVLELGRWVSAGHDGQRDTSVFSNRGVRRNADNQRALRRRHLPKTGYITVQRGCCACSGFGSGKANLSGQSLASSPFVFPVLALLLFALLDLGRAVYMYNTLANAARQGARVAAVNQNAGNGVCDYPIEHGVHRAVRDGSGISIPVQKTDIDISTSALLRYQGNGPTMYRRGHRLPDVHAFHALNRRNHGPIQLRASSDMPVEAWYP